MILATNQDPNNHFYNYLCYIKARFRPENKKIAEQERYSAFNKAKKSMYFKEKDGTLFTEEEKFNAKYNFLITYSESSVTYKSGEGSKASEEDKN